MRVFLSLILFFALALPATRLRAADCAVELVLAMDVSRSVDAAEYRLIRHGTAEAFRAPEIIELISWLPGGILITVTQWSGVGNQRQVLPWRHLVDAAGIARFADDIDAMKRVYRYELTAPGEALAHAESLGASAPMTCRRRVIDIAGDGVRNAGLEAGPVADGLAVRGVTINGLVVRGDTPDPLEFYRWQIKRGPLSFIEIAKGYDDFPKAMFRKLLRELSPSLSALPPAPKG